MSHDFRTVPLAAALILACVSGLVPGCGRQDSDSAERSDAPATQASPRAAQPFTSGEEVNEWMFTYRRHKDPARVIDAFRYLSEDGSFELGYELATLATFFGEVFAQNPDRLREWTDDLLRIDQKYWGVLVQSLWLSNSEEGMVEVRRIAGMLEGERAERTRRLTQEQPPNMKEIAITSPREIDLLWACHSATGDDVYIQRIASVLPLLEDERNAGSVMLGGAAKWSLTSNAVRYPEVLEACNRVLGEVHGELREQLLAVIDEAMLELDKARLNAQE